MKNHPSKSTKDTQPMASRKSSLLQQYREPCSNDPIAPCFTDEPEAKWPKPSAVELAQIAISLGNGPEAPQEAVRLVWECALAQDTQVAAVRRFQEQLAHHEEDLTLLQTRLHLKPEDYSITHRFFLSKLNLSELQARPGCVVRGQKLWMEFVRQLPRKSLFRDLIRPGWGDRSFFNSASGQSGEEWEAERKALGWVDAEIIMWFFRKFDGWRQKIITSNKRKGGLAKKPRSGVKMDADAGEEAK